MTEVSAMTDVAEMVVQEPIEEAADEQAAPEGGSKGKAVVDADNTENGDKNVQDALEAKIAQMSAKKTEDKSGEKELSRLYKKATKDLKEQLDAIPSESEKVKVLEKKFLEKVHQCNTADRKVDNLQVRFIYACSLHEFTVLQKQMGRTCSQTSLLFFTLLLVSVFTAVLGGCAARQRQPHE